MQGSPVALLRWLSAPKGRPVWLYRLESRGLLAALKAIGGRIQGCDRRQGCAITAGILQGFRDMSITAGMHLCFGAKDAEFTASPAPRLCKRTRICSRPFPLSQLRLFCCLDRLIFAWVAGSRLLQQQSQKSPGLAKAF